jgi:Flp pilus assembly protein TadD
MTRGATGIQGYGSVDLRLQGAVTAEATRLSRPQGTSILPGWSIAEVGLVILLGIGLALGQESGRLNPSLGCSEKAQLHNQSGIKLARSGNLLAALQEFRQAVRACPQDAQANYNLGITLKEVGELDQAIDVLHTAASLDPASGPAHLSLGLALANRNELEAAVPELHRAAELLPDSVEARYNLGLAQARLGKLQDAATELRAASACSQDSNQRT